MVKWLSILMICFLALEAEAQNDKYYRISIDDIDKTLDKLSQSDISLEYLKSENHLLLEVSGYELSLLDDLNIDYEIIISDLQEFYSSRNRSKDANLILENFRNREDYNVPEHFSLGSMGGFCTHDEMLAHLDSMHLRYPDLITQKEALPGESIQGLPVYFLQISDNPGVSEGEPEIFYNSLIHAREPASMQQLLYFMYFLLENYNNDEQIKNLVDHTSMYFVPCINPDGYIYNEQTFPEGGGMWRKNRRVNLNNTKGVDLNRNFSYMWGYDDYGSSPNPSSSTYRGEAPFSEPETQIIRNFIEDHDFKLVMNYHSFGNVILFPWGYVSYLNPPDYNQIREVALLLTTANQMEFGATSRVLYLTNGDANDWIYGEDITKPSALAYTAEVGSESDGFWPPVENIIPLCQQFLSTNLQAAKLVGFYAQLSDEGPAFIAHAEGHLPFSFSRVGLSDQPFVLSVLPVGESFIFIDGMKQYASTPWSEKIYDSVFYQLNPNLLPGDRIEYVLKIQTDAFVVTDTITKIFGPEVTLKADDFDDLTGWDSDDWYLRDNKVYSPLFSLSNVAGSYYANNTVSFIYRKDTIIPDRTADVWVNFKAKWDLDGGMDYVKFMYSKDYGQSWEPLTGRYSSVFLNGNNVNPVYEGEADEWIDEWIFIPNVFKVPLMFGFYFESDGSSGRSGFYCDDFRVLTSQDQWLQQSVLIQEGWSGISSFLLPGQTDIGELFGANFSNLDFIIDETSFYQPGNENSNLFSWDSGHGFQLKSNQSFTLELTGFRNRQLIFPLHAGWNLIPVNSTQPMSIGEITTNPPGLIRAVKDACGVYLYWPEKNIYSLQTLLPGKSYFINMVNDGDLIVE